MSKRTYTIRRIRTHFSRVGYEVRIFNPDGSIYPVPLTYQGEKGIWFETQPIRFYGDDGRSVRADAEAFAKHHSKIGPN